MNYNRVSLNGHNPSPILAATLYPSGPCYCPPTHRPCPTILHYDYTQLCGGCRAGIHTQYYRDQYVTKYRQIFSNGFLWYSYSTVYHFHGDVVGWCVRWWFKLKLDHSHLHIFCKSWTRISDTKKLISLNLNTSIPSQLSLNSISNS